MEESVEPNSAKKFEAINSDNCPHFALVSYFVKKRFRRKSSDSGHGNLDLILQVEWDRNFDGIRTNFLQVLTYYSFSRSLFYDDVRH